MARPALAVLADEIVACRRCPRLARYLREIGVRRKREFATCDYWARPLPGFGDPHPALLVVGLAPAAHGGARTGRMFTGDSSGNFLARAMCKAGFASQPTSTTREDGLALPGAYITAAARCAPPDNKPLPEELARCRVYLVRELRLLPSVRVVVALGRIAWDAMLRAAGEADWRMAPPADWRMAPPAGRRHGPTDRNDPERPRPGPPPHERRPAFAHAAEAAWIRPDGEPVLLIASYHPSRQNTNTGRLTEPMFDGIFARARAALLLAPR